MRLHRLIHFACGVLVLATGAHAEQPETSAKTGHERGENAALLPLELTAFGDFRYRIERAASDDFEIGSVELDATLELSPHVNVATAFAYDAEVDGVGIAAFTVDGSLMGSDPKHLLKTELVQDFGLIFGKFDVPFGVAYLEYAAPDNHFVLTPAAVDRTHRAWNDLGIQAYLVGDHFNTTLYAVNGEGLGDEGDPAPDHALGGRLGLLPVPELEFGASLAATEGPSETLLLGGDLTANAGPLALRNEYIARRSESGDTVEGFYSEALARAPVLFGGARYEAVLANDRITERAGTLTVGAEVFPRAEIRLAHRHSFQEPSDITFIQIVGGSSFQPTGLRR